MSTTNPTTNLVCYKTMPQWDNKTLPRAFQKRHNTKVGTWAKLTILSGKLKYYALDEADNVLETFVFDKDSDIPFVEPQAWHKVEPLTEDLQCQLAFYCQPVDYYHKKYQLSKVHSEVLALTEIMNDEDRVGDKESVQVLKALDFGCGGGRNALYLQQQGFEVTAVDRNPNSIGKLQQIIDGEQLNNISTSIVDINQTQDYDDKLEQYDVVVSTVVMMFLDKNKIADIIHTMQAHTKPNGYNLIVCAMDTEDLPFSNYELPFGFGFKEDELKGYYQDWQIKKYNEDIGHLHRLDRNGNPVALHFATLIAKKQA